MLYLKENPLLREPLKAEQTKPRLLGHWGSDAGQSFTYIHFNRLINKYDLNAIFISGPGHGAPAVLSNAYLEGTYSEIYPDKSEDVAGMQRFFKQFTFLAGSAATPLLKPRAAFTKAGSSGTASPTLMERSSTIPT
jgi:xylulose-5-phosphate/fructose-6-phosphate phosphoketolase